MECTCHFCRQTKRIDDKHDLLFFFKGEYKLFSDTSAQAHLARRAVGQTALAVCGQVKVGGACTLVAPARGEQTQVTAAAVVYLTRMAGHW